MKLIEFKCPSCGADLKTDASREMMYCEYCGKRLILDDESMRVRISIDNAREAGFEFEMERTAFAMPPEELQTGVMLEIRYGEGYEPVEILYYSAE